MRTRKRDDPIREEDVQGLKYFRKLWPLFERLHDVGCSRDKAAQSSVGRRNFRCGCDSTKLHSSICGSYAPDPERLLLSRRA